MAQSYRNSKQRLLVLEALQNSGQHPTAEYIFDIVRRQDPNISLGTVYRNLDVLCKQSRIARVGLPSGPEAFDANPVPHYHFVCSHCGRIMDVPLDYQHPIDQAMRALGCKVFGHRLILDGICPDCVQATL